MALVIALDYASFAANGKSLSLSLVCMASKAWRTAPFFFPQKAIPATVTLTRMESSTVGTGGG